MNVEPAGRHGQRLPTIGSAFFSDRESPWSVNTNEFTVGDCRPVVPRLFAARVVRRRQAERIGDYRIGQGRSSGGRGFA